MFQEAILHQIRQLIGHTFIMLTDRGNAAISAALALTPRNKKILIPAEGGWIHYKKAPKQLGLAYEEVACDDAKINLKDLQKKLTTGLFGTFLYQQPGGYFAEQPAEEMYRLCQKHNCLVIMDVSGALGTPLCSGANADILVASFGEEKLVNAGVGGFISCKEREMFEKITIAPFADEEKLQIIEEKIERLPERIAFLEGKRKRIVEELKTFQIVHASENGFVIVVKFSTSAEKEKLIAYCKENNLPWTECPRYIRLNTPAISIEVKKL